MGALLLVADIGGTNARFGLARKTPAGAFHIQAQHTLKCDDFADPGALVRAYLARLDRDTQSPQYACLAVAGPVSNDIIEMTNRQWRCAGDALAQQLDIKVVKVLNDWAAMAYAAPFFAATDIETLFVGTPDPQGTFALMGPGTGFGASALKPTGRGYEILATEGGHVAFAPGDARELELLGLLRRERDYVSVEDLLSGAGLVTIYRGLAQLAGLTPTPKKPNEITAAGLSGTDPLCVEALTLFCNVLGGVAGDKALDFYASGGVFIGGGIVPHLKDFLSRTDFMVRFQHKGLMTPFTSHIPLHLIKTDNAALIGCAAWLETFIT
ncbi:glucokinase [Exilibacterium tricleocarpae]|nr:glucokinase [Exilibacterium tricleocarpae]